MLLKGKWLIYIPTKDYIDNRSAGIISYNLPIQQVDIIIVLQMILKHMWLSHILYGHILPFPWNRLNLDLQKICLI